MSWETHRNLRVLCDCKRILRAKLGPKHHMMQCECGAYYRCDGVKAGDDEVDVSIMADAKAQSPRTRQLSGRTCTCVFDCPHQSRFFKEKLLQDKEDAC